MIFAATEGIPFSTTIVGIITALSALFIALGGTIAAMTVFLPILRKTKAAVEEVHTIVNQQRTDMERYQRALVSALKAAGVDVPADQSLPADDLQ